MGKKVTIDHKGEITEIRIDSIIVKIENKSACSACHAKSACSMSDIQDKYIEVNPNLTDIKNYRKGEVVNVICSEELGFIALFWAYVFPFILVITTLIICNQVTNNELTVGLMSLVVLVPYYIALSLFKRRFKKKFSFEIRKIK